MQFNKIFLVLTLYSNFKYSKENSLNRYAQPLIINNKDTIINEATIQSNGMIIDKKQLTTDKYIPFSTTILLLIAMMMGFIFIFYKNTLMIVNFFYYAIDNNNNYSIKTIPLFLLISIIIISVLSFYMFKYNISQGKYYGIRLLYIIIYFSVIIKVYYNYRVNDDPYCNFDNQQYIEFISLYMLVNLIMVTISYFMDYFLWKKYRDNPLNNNYNKEILTKIKNPIKFFFISMIKEAIIFLIFWILNHKSSFIFWNDYTNLDNRSSILINMVINLIFNIILIVFSDYSWVQNKSFIIKFLISNMIFNGIVCFIIIEKEWNTITMFYGTITTFLLTSSYYLINDMVNVIKNIGINNKSFNKFMEPIKPFFKLLLFNLIQSLCLMDILISLTLQKLQLNAKIINHIICNGIINIIGLWISNFSWQKNKSFIIKFLMGKILINFIIVIYNYFMAPNYNDFISHTYNDLIAYTSIISWSIINIYFFIKAILQSLDNYNKTQSNILIKDILESIDNHHKTQSNILIQDISKSIDNYETTKSKNILIKDILQSLDNYNKTQSNILIKDILESIYNHHETQSNILIKDILESIDNKISLQSKIID